MTQDRDPFRNVRPRCKICNVPMEIWKGADGFLFASPNCVHDDEVFKRYGMYMQDLQVDLNLPNDWRGDE